MIEISWYVLIFLLGMLIGLIIGILRGFYFYKKKFPCYDRETEV